METMFVISAITVLNFQMLAKQIPMATVLVMPATIATMWPTQIKPIWILTEKVMSVMIMPWVRMKKKNQWQSRMSTPVIT